jgi:hypothetical protein
VEAEDEDVVDAVFCPLPEPWRTDVAVAADAHDVEGAVASQGRNTMAGVEEHAMIGAPDGVEEHAAVRGTVASTGCRATVHVEGRTMVDEARASADEHAASHIAKADTEQLDADVEDEPGAMGLAAVVEADAYAEELGTDVGDEAGAEELAPTAEAKADADALPNDTGQAVAVELDVSATRQ